ncbi:hypothetical protein GCM10020000_82810 [Streptomyces olivoverticillatus]
MESTDQVTGATERLKAAGLATFEENDTSCCYALQDKVWVHGPGREPWEVYVVKADAFSKSALQAGTASCTGAPTISDGQATVEAKEENSCICGG